MSEDDALRVEQTTPLERWLSEDNDRLRRERNDCLAEVERLREALGEMRSHHQNILGMAVEQFAACAAQALDKEAEVERLRVANDQLHDELVDAEAAIQRVREERDAEVQRLLVVAREIADEYIAMLNTIQRVRALLPDSPSLVEICCVPCPRLIAALEGETDE
jgi:uncharacterized coiled-coil DUF342 family protein